ncbi:hypothetical protein NS234_04875 [Microbacterium oxydans]|uniref:hypothetical protein n=1 Tax=Microbacterium oxydans TaxID=82380 RepID=UPI0007347857|nr:hypothetical protein [Microbacterium oxydans]KTR78004.1 hypothetical protein NS234_04875 [Microbacterium oxydans]
MSLTANLRDELIAIREQFGYLNPKAVVDVARDNKHPLHHRFEWVDTIAAEKYRLQQAGDLIRRVKISYLDSTEKPQEIRAFLAVRAPTDEDGAATAAYVPTEEAMSDPFTSALLLREFERDWKSFKAKYQHLKEFAAMIRKDVAA